MSNNKEQELQIKMPEGLSPVFSNAARVLHSDDEFSLHFAQTIPGTNRAEAKAIVSLTPSHAKRLLKAIEREIQDFESKFGEIELPEEPGSKEKPDYVG
ncbi:hypothetical protein AKJ65_04185 [candidate division MSBL1 archaeon SCGC-AAA259E19]|uniref:DUF3467 domain-containing protein n=2 Tax=candidate division MSBL1 TaxID=215777 RepID=A0A133V064_9EURY|nr:hypothetical protein AKJ65_04185 [candidate division MSBL1 archaeon SCGC-AAA259E19]KXA99826.1 hypothetical protein AKJ41_04815 [candidate division MSBL1 archaeon SCGC-AAA259O05]